ncbi:MAG: PHP domain-containing protein [Christensenellales bacterium]
MFDSERKFYKGNLHTHTTCSDGKKPPDEVVELYASRGYDFLALTDHWKIACDTHFHKEMLVLSGMETDYDLPAQVVHLVALGVGREFAQAVKKEQGPQKGIDLIRAHGGLSVLAHPAWSLNTPETIGALRGVDLAEIYNAVSGAPWNGERADATNLLDIAAAHGTVLNTVAADDAHFYDGDACCAYIMLQADELSQGAILGALRGNRWYSSTGADFLQIEVTPEEIAVHTSPVSRVLFLSDAFYAKERCQTGANITRATYPIKKERGEIFVRVKIMDADGKCAWSNPILL